MYTYRSRKGAYYRICTAIHLVYVDDVTFSCSKCRRCEMDAVGMSARYAV